jgi:[FeFe] hydrogenase H-cluster maturation GTPase HydF
MELHGIGPCVIIDTPGFDDEGTLGEMRIERTLKAIERTDIALLFCEENDLRIETEWKKQLEAKNIPVILILNKADIRKDTPSISDNIGKALGQKPLIVSAKEKQGIEEIRLAILEKLPQDFEQPSITGDLVDENDLVLLVMPQDIQAPKGRLILPQVQTMRELLDKKCLVMSCTTDKFPQTLQALAYPPKLIITDSQVFKTVYEQKPTKSLLTSFSVLMAGYKGDIRQFIEGASAIDSLTENSHVLIAEACAHAPMTEDIGRVKIPRLLRKKIGEGLQIDMVSGSDFPKDLSKYDLIIHCGACMFNRKHVMNRLDSASHQQVPMTNYGITLAHLMGILNKIVY